METIITVQGNVKHNITLDPTVWIFDDRRIDLNTYFNEDRIEIDEDEKYLNSMGKHWSREIMEGATFPPTLKTEKKFDRKKMVTGTFGILLKPFLKNAVPGENAETITFVTSTNHEETFSLSEAEDFIFKFSQDGKPLLEDGPVHLLFNDGSNIENPLKAISGIVIK
ncbi:peptidyl-prolyl cis-trans isomerase [Sporosarcina thermotolerans]|uniref:Peptidyl-prolyl cis-trans isomerase n=1 Tax=Sporosarcina thermotolerans TaxID=633404 RepID=A0AAW9A6G4_9BACL|nr:peptidyl-prolyl cis-trans isomerase [Sporosarcina thermotolerans]MDW0115860.1 peptidyl-prolyl cis-trans isomerase [Sporosarcina thermotolerans]WHT46914.1 peptidyl-prolyl cis-trans isomerase [Sporosarcina thermotolerans]